MVPPIRPIGPRPGPGPDPAPDALHVIDVARHPFVTALGRTPALSETQVDLLRRVVTDDAFRQSFLKDPMHAVVTTGVRISPGELDALTKLTPAAFDALQTSINRIAAEDGTSTLAYAVALAVVVALLMA